MTRRDFEDYMRTLLETESLEDFLERYDLEPAEAMMLLFDAGYLDLDIEDDETLEEWDE